MSDYIRTYWKDHIVDDATGKVLQEGTPLDAAHLNNIEKALVAMAARLNTAIEALSNAGDITPWATELADIRVDAAGKEYLTAGESVRSQLKPSLSTIETIIGKNMINPAELMHQYKLTETGEIEEATGDNAFRHVVTGYMAVESGNTYYPSINGEVITTNAKCDKICVYDAAKNFVRVVSSVTSITIEEGEAYIRIDFYSYADEVNADLVASTYQVEEGGISTYEPYSETYEIDYKHLTNVPKSGEDLETEMNVVIDKYNLYNKSNNISGYINSSGTVKAAGSSYICKVAVIPEETYYIYRPQKQYYGAETGLMLVLDESDEVIETVDMSTLEAVTSNGIQGVKYVASENAAYIEYNVALDSSYDSTEDNIVTMRTPEVTDYNDVVEALFGAALATPTMIQNLISEQLEIFSRSRWKGKQLTIYGDSISATDNNTTTMRYHDYIAEETGITVVNMADSGKGYMRGKDSGTAFYQTISNVPTDSDIVIIFGSGNDLSQDLPMGEITDTGTDTVCGCINTTLDNYYSVLPTTPIGIISPAPWKGLTPLDSNTMMAEYVEKLGAICANRNIPFKDLYHGSGLRPNDETFRALCYANDDGGGTHPSELGHKLYLAPPIREFIGSLI